MPLKYLDDTLEYTEPTVAVEAMYTISYFLDSSVDRTLSPVVGDEYATSAHEGDEVSFKLERTVTGPVSPTTDSFVHIFGIVPEGVSVENCTIYQLEQSKSFEGTQVLLLAYTYTFTMPARDVTVKVFNVVQ